MIFTLWHPSSTCAARRDGRVLASQAGLRGMSIVSLSEALGLAWRFR